MSCCAVLQAAALLGTLAHVLSRYFCTPLRRDVGAGPLTPSGLEGWVDKEGVGSTPLRCGARVTG